MYEARSRVKGETPNLGWLIPLIALGGDRQGWKHVGPLIVGEAVDRSIIWICKRYSGLQKSLMKSPSCDEADAELLSRSFEAAAVGMKLIAFHAAFLKLVARPEGSTLVQVNPCSELASSQQLNETFDLIWLLQAACHAHVTDFQAVGIIKVAACYNLLYFFLACLNKGDHCNPGSCL